MKTIGIVAEYNPFHIGHAFHIRETRRLFQEETAVVAVMSGNWVQRGECAVTDKWTRAEMALAGGADMVLELPTVWAVSSAEGFARGAIAILAATGVVNTLSFGSERGEIAPLRELARCFNSPDFPTALRRELGPKHSFAWSRRRAAEALLGPERAALLDLPNNNLGVEYLRFLPPEMEAVTIPRRGAGHDSSSEEDGIPSASLLRRHLRLGELTSVSPCLSLSWRGEAADMKWIERAVLARLRSMTPEEAEALPDSGGGLAIRLLRAAQQAGGLEELYALTKTRSYTHSRVRRLALCALLGLREQDRPAAPPYLRVLGANGRGCQILREMKQKAAVPILTKPAQGKGIPLLELEARCTDLFALCFPTPRPGGLEWTTNPVVIM